MDRKKSRNVPEEKPVIIIVNGPLPPEEFVQKYIEHAYMIICADGGANRIAGFEIQPDIIIGDMDSVTKETLQKLSNITLIRRPEQESSDLQKALEFIESRVQGKQKVVVLGASGERQDHFLGSISLLPQFADRLSVEIVDEWCTIRFVGKHMMITGVPGQIVSLWSLSAKATGVTTTGLKYPLRNAALAQGTRGISNEFCAHEASITVRSGNLLAIIHHPG